MSIEKYRQGYLDNLKNQLTQEWTVTHLNNHPKLKDYDLFEIWELEPLDKESLNLLLGIPKGFPFVECKIFCKESDRSKVQNTLHIDSNLFICTYDFSYLEIPPYNAVDGTIDLIKQATRILQQERNQQEFEEEFVAYWNQKTTGSIEAYFSSNNSTLSTYQVSKRLILHEGKQLEKLGLTQEKSKGLIIEVQAYPNSIPHKGNELLDWLKDNSINLQTHIKDYKKHDLYVILQIKQESYVGFRLPNRINTYRGNPAYWGFFGDSAVEKVRLKIFKPDTFYKRAGQLKQTRNETVLTLGCGSIGSHITSSLLIAGFTKFSLCDNDSLEVNNLGRHVCNADDIRRNKAEAVEHYLIKKYPLVESQAFKSDITNAYLSNKDIISEANLIIEATGRHSPLLFLQRVLKLHPANRTIAILWVESNMIAGHLLLFKESQIDDLLSRFFDSDNLYLFRLIKNPTQDKYLKRQPGCQGSYTEYGGLDFLSFINSCAKTIVKHLDEGLSSPSLFCFTGDLDSEDKKELSKFCLSHPIQSFSSYTRVSQGWQKYAV